MIKASTVEEHVFGVVRRRGYDRSEVDAVMDRLASSIRDYEERTSALEQRAAEADESVDAVRRTLLLAQRAGEDIRREATAEAESVRGDARVAADAAVADARNDAEALVAAARQVVENATSEAEATQIAATYKVEERLEAAVELATSIRSEAEVALAQAQVDAARHHDAGRAEATAVLGAAATEAAEMVRVASAEASEIVSSAEHATTDLIAAARREADAIVGDARRDEQQLTVHLERLRVAVREVEEKVEALAESTLERARTISDTIELDVPTPRPAGPATRTGVSGGSDASTIVPGAPGADEPEVVYLAAVGKARGRRPAAPDESARAIPADPVADEDGRTYYQRRTSSLRARIAEADKEN